MIDASYTRQQARTLSERLIEPRRFIQVVAGPRQVGKTTLDNIVYRPFTRCDPDPIRWTG